MKIKRGLLALMAFTLMFTTVVSARPMDKHHTKVIGEVMEVKKIDDNTTHVTVDGYVNGEEIVKEKVILIVNDKTKIANSEMLKKFMKNHENNKEEGKKVEIPNTEKEPKITLEKGDKVMAVISDVMTKSIPPQTVAKFIKVTKVVE